MKNILFKCDLCTKVIADCPPNSDFERRMEKDAMTIRAMHTNGVTSGYTSMLVKITADPGDGRQEGRATPVVRHLCRECMAVILQDAIDVLKECSNT